MPNKKSPKYIFVTGGVLSGLGKGIVAASIGNILKARGYEVNIQKFDQYINVDAGTLNPTEHGEVFVTDDGAETDLDLGHYERFIDKNLTQKSSIMTGNIYNNVIAAERRGEYLGKTVQIIPHITDEAKKQLKEAASESKADVHIAEIGGTIGDYEGLYLLEAIRQMKAEVGEENVLYVHVVFLPYLAASCEIKTKPAQNSVRELRGIGVSPDVLIARSDHEITEHAVEKMSLFCDVEKKAIIPVPTVKTIYEVPLMLEKSNLSNYICEKLNLKNATPDFDDWEDVILKASSMKEKLTIGLVGKYMAHQDTYLSVTEAVKAACWAHHREPDIKWIDSEVLETESGIDQLKDVTGIIVPGGFGERGIEGKVKAAKFARKHKIPYLGLCLGMQIAVIEFARNVLCSDEVNSTEFDAKVKHPAICLMSEQRDVCEKGGTMRLGAYPCVLNKKSKSYEAYGKEKISERHRHRFEFNNKYRKQLEEAGLLIAGTSPDNKLVEIIEISDHPFFVASQFHPEFKSRPNKPHPLFRDF
ncbi:MAG: CTP synthase, partial [Candidatus Moranbacteria bacterium]|nr:CTP synthase [Candidatus Moranbacteria bacterium]